MADIRLEVPAENSVLEILYDGTEKHQPPPSMSENLTQLARKVDFGAVNGEDPSTTDDKDDNEDDDEKPFRQPHWAFESVRNKIRSALTEVCVLHDLLQIVRDKRYMILDPVQNNAPDSKPYIQFLALKKSLNIAASTLFNGAERLRTSQHELNRGRQNSDFHIELLRLRQNWRLKKIGNNIIGDLSYRSAGSQFKHTGLFEVTKSEEVVPIPTLPIVPGRASPLTQVIPQRLTNQCPLKVTVPAELEGSAYIFVCIREDEEDLCRVPVTMNPVSSKDTYWQQKLERAQNVLFCKELFSQLAKEAVILKPPIPYLVVGNQITATIFPGIHLVIALSHSDNESTLTNGNSNMSSSSNIPGSSVGGGGPSKSHSAVLEHSLHQLLHKCFQSQFTTPLPHPVYAPMGVSKKRRVAGPEGIDRDQILQTTKSETLLEQIIKQAQHEFLRLRTMLAIDQLSKELKDPLIVSHWNVFSSPTQSCVRINIVTQSFDSVARTTLVIHIYEKTLKCVCRDGKVISLSFEPQELINLIQCQVSLHHMAAIQGFSKYMGWTVISSENNLGIGPAELSGNASSVVLQSANGNRVLAVKTGPTTGRSVFVATCPRNDFYTYDIVNERRWEHLNGTWQEVRLDRMDGRNFLTNIELLMAALTAQA